MTPRTVAVGVVAAALAWAAPAIGESDEPVAYDLWLDADLAPHPENPNEDVFVEGDSLSVHVDPTRMFPDRATPMFALGFAPDAAPPEVKGVYVVGPGGGVDTPLSIQPGACGLAQAIDRAKTANDDLAVKQQAQRSVGADSAATAAAKQAAAQAVHDAEAAASQATAAKAEVVVAPASGGGTCAQAIDWRLTGGRGRAYICDGDQTLAVLIEKSSEWSLVQRVPKDPANPRRDEFKLVCIDEWQLAKGPSVSAVSAEIIHGANAPETVIFAKDRGAWATTVAIKRNTRQIRVAVTYDNGAVQQRTLVVKPRARDTHSLVRIQAEILATNRFRSVSFAVAVSPVRRAFFTAGPSPSCIALCAITPTALLRLSGDDKTVVQFGGGLALNLARAFQVNGGVLFGTADTATAWRLERNWFVGIAIDPVLLSEVISAGKKE
jgi:hypothetical protein